MLASTEESGPTKEACFFCTNMEDGVLHKANTFGLDSKFPSCAIELKDTKLLAKLAAGDLKATDA